jgi:hypothetical protein
MAAPTTVQLRVEGASTTLFEGPVTTDAKTITKGANTLACDGGGPDPGPTMTTALDDGSIAGGFTWDADFFGDFFVTRIGPDAQTADKSWGIAVNFVPAQVGGCQQQVRSGDEVLFAGGYFGGPPDYASKRLLKLIGAATTPVGQPVTVTVTDGQNGAKVAGASITGAAGGATGPDGQATVSLGSPGVKRLKAERSDSIRSNALDICVYEPGSGACDSFVPPAAARVKDSRAPTARASSPRHRARYRRGPRLLQGTASDSESGIELVKLSLRRHTGEGCRWWSGTRERFVGSNCHRKVFFGIGDDPEWSYLLPRPLGPGHYVLDVKVVDRSGNYEVARSRGRNRIIFDVVERRDARGAEAAGKRRGASVEVMVVGQERVLAAARTVHARAIGLKASGRRCLVGASTPLAALAEAASRSHLSYHVRDFGRCSAREAASSGQLFVDRVAAERNSQNNGWFYKVNVRAGTAGGADGSSRLHSGDRVLWFYCLFDNRARGCQQSLEAVPAARVGRAGESLPVQVRGRDNEGKGRAVAGATVSLGASAALTDASGRLQLALPRPGRHLLTASKAGTVPSFPVAVAVQQP